MKKTSKIFSVILALALVFAMAIPAFAAGEGKITITNAIAKQTYTVYKMMSFTPVAGGDATSNNGFYTVEADWENFISGDGAAYLAKDEANGTVVWVGEKTEERRSALAKLAVEYAKTKGLTGEEKTPDADGVVEFTGLDLGYYAIDTSLGTVCGLTNTNEEFTAHEKNTQPTIKKEVQEDSTKEWGAVNDAEIGDTVNFKTTVSAKANSTNYVVHDKMEAGLTLKAETIEVEGLTKDTDYTVKTTGLDADGCTFELTFTQDYLDTITADTDIVITYSAVLNKDAEIVTDTNDNTTWLTYGDNATATAESKTKTLTYYFNLKKVDTEGKLLEGAEFTLSNEEGVMSFVAIEGGYRVATAEDENTTTTIVAGEVVIKGLDADTYTLTETKAPANYNLLDNPINVTVNKATVGETITYEAAEEEVVNKTGSLLPETGGIGTTIFYIVGAILVVGAVVVLVSKKRTSAEA